jgi:hypothetical protein
MVNKGSASKTVSLQFAHETGGPVYVAGTFNNWNVGSHPMKKNKQGGWETKLKLPPGEYQFRYFADGCWYTDFAADGVIPNGFGEFNSVLRVANGQAARDGK